MMSSRRATYSPTLSPLSIGHMLNSARSICKFSEFSRKRDQRARLDVDYTHREPKGRPGMRHWIVSAAVLLISSSFALAQAPEPTRVLVAPFTEVNEQQQPDWISRAVRQSVV